MATFTRVHGFGNYAAGTLYSVAQTAAYLITVKNTGGTAQDLRAEDGTAAEQVIESLVREVQPLMYQAADANTGVIHIIVDGHAVDAATLQARIRNMGTVNSIDVSGTTVAKGTSITVA